MLSSYVKSAVRSMRTNKVPSVINVAGLAIAISVSVVVYLFLQTYYLLDTFHAHGDRIFMVEHVVERDGVAQTWGTAPLPLGPALATEVPQVERAVRLAWAGADVRTEAHAFEERMAFADPGFFEMFTFPFQAGSAAALNDPGAVILSDETARKFFGDVDPMGQTLVVALADGPARVLTVGGVTAPFPNEASFRFHLLAGFDARPDAARADDWAAFTAGTFILLRHPEDAAAVMAQMETYVTRQNAAANDWRIKAFVLDNLRHPALNAYQVIRRPTEAPHPAFSLIMVGIAAFILLLACVNYVNIALGQAARRLREIGVRKVMGSTKGQLVTQFMAENLLLCTIALGLGIGLAWLFLVPLFNQVFVLQIGFAAAGDVWLWGFLAGLLAVVGVASGAYPAFYVASFEPALVFRGKQRLAEKRWLTRSLLTVQFVIAFLAVILSIVLLMNERYLLDQAWGYDHEQTVVVRLSDEGQFGYLRDAALQYGAVRAVAGSHDHLGASWGRVEFTVDEETAEEAPSRHEAVSYAVGPSYAEALGLRMLQGRFFDAHHSTDMAEAVVVNRRLVDERGWTEPVGRTLRIDGRPYTVIGIVENFLYNPVVRVRPAVFRQAAPETHRFLSMRVAPGSEAAALDYLKAQWARHVPEVPFDGFLHRTVFDEQYRSYGNLARGIGYLAALAVLIACMGLFGLATQNVARRMKEVSIRKVLGASVPHIVLLINRAFVWILAAAALVATLVSYGGLRVLHSLDVINLMPLTPAPFVIAYALMLATVTVSVATQSHKMALTNPVDSLRRD